MSSCINPNNRWVQEKIEKGMDPIQAIASYMEAALEANEMDSEKVFERTPILKPSEKEIANFENNHASEELKEAMSENVALLGSHRAYYDYLHHGRIRPAGEIVEQLSIGSEMTLEDLISIDNDSTVEGIIKATNNKTAMAYANDLSDRLGVDYVLISENEFEELHPGKSAKDNPAFFVKGKVYFVDGYVTPDIAFHEFSHPVVKSIANSNRPLFDSLWEQFQSHPTANSIIERLALENQLEKDSDEYKEEALVMALQDEFRNPTKSSFIQELLFQIRQFLRKMFGTTANVSKLSPKTTLAELAKMINEGKSLVLDNEFLNSNEFTMFMTEYDNLEESIRNSKAEVVQNIIDEYYDIVSKQVSVMKSDDPVYRLAAETLVTEGSSGLLEQVKKTLSNLAYANSKKDTTSLTSLNEAVDSETVRIDSIIRSFASTIGEIKVMTNVFGKKVDYLENLTDRRSDMFFDSTLGLQNLLQQWSQQYTSWLTAIPATTGTRYFEEYLRKELSQINTLLSRVNKMQQDAVVDLLYQNFVDQNAEIIKQLKDEMAYYQEKGMTGPYESSHNALYGMTVSERAELRVLQGKQDGFMTAEEQRRMNELQRFEQSGHTMSKETFARIIFGLSGDLNVGSALSGFLENYNQNQDPLLSTFFNTMKDTFKEMNGNINARQSEFLNGLQPLLKKAGFDNTFFGEGGFGDRIKQVSTVTRSVNETSVEPFEVYEFMSNFVNWRHALDVLRKNVENALTTHKLNNTEESRKALNAAKKELEQFEKDYMHRDYTDEVYKLQELFDSPAGEKAKELQDALFSRMNLINSNLAVSPNDPDYRQALIDTWTEYRMLASLYDANGKLKTDPEELEIAKILTEFREKSKEFYEMTETPMLFEAAFNTFFEDLNERMDPTDPQYNEEIASYLRSNTMVKVSDEHYEKRNALREERKEIMAALNEANKKIYDLEPLYEQMYSLIRTTRDENNIVDGSQMSSDKQAEILRLQNQINSVRDRMLTVNGLSKQDSRMYHSLLREGSKRPLTEFEQQFILEFANKIANKQNNLGLSTEQLTRLKEIDDALAEMTQTIPTEAYTQQFLHHVKGNEEVLKIFENELLAKVVGASIDDSIVDGEVFNELIHYNAPILEKMLEADNYGEFTEWFLRNHYEDDYILKYNLTTRSMVPTKGYRKSAAWQTTRPDGFQEFEKKAVLNMPTLPAQFVQNGVLVLDGIPVVPSMQYWSRDVKEQYRTQKIYRDTVVNGELVLANIDNKGNWLPKDFIPGDPASAKDGKFINADYKKLFNEERDVWNALDYVKNAQLDIDETIPRGARLYMEFPSFRKGEVEQYDRDYFSRKALRAKEFIYGAADDYVVGANTDVMREDPYKTFAHPIAGNFRINKMDVSTNIVRSVMQRVASVEEYKTRRKKSSVARSLQRTMKSMMLPQSTLTKWERIVKFKQLTTNPDEYRRLNQIDRMIARFIDGQNLVPVKWAPTSVTVTTSKTISALQRRLSWMSFAISPDKSLRNYLGGKIQLWKKALDVGGYSFADLTATRHKSAQVIGAYAASRYSKENPGVEWQLLSVLDAIPGRTKQEAGMRGSNTLQQDIATGNWAYADRKYLNDSVPVHQIYALMHANKFKIGGKRVALWEAVELVDGKIQTKSGVPEEWAITYDNSGNIVLGKKIKELMDTHDSLLIKNIGVSGHLSDAEVSRHLVGKVAFTMMRFFTGMAMDRFQATISKADLRQGKLRLSRRKNLNQRRLEMGTYLSAIALLQEAYERKGKFWALRSYSPQAVRGMYQLLATVGMQIMMAMLVKSFWFDEDDDEEGDFRFDPTEDKMFSRIGNTTSLPNLPWISDNQTIYGTGNGFHMQNYSKLHMLNLLISVQQEEQTFNPSQMVTNTLGIGSMNSALSTGGAIDTFKDLLNIWASDEGDRYYKRDASAYEWGEKEDYKMWQTISRFAGLPGNLPDPAKMIETKYNFKK